MPDTKSTVQAAAKSGQGLVHGLDRGLELLELLSYEHAPMTVAQLTRRLGIPRTTVVRLLATLERKGYVEVDPSRKLHVLGPAILRLGYQFLSSRDVVQLAREDLEALARATGISAHLMSRDRRDIVYLLHVLGNSNFVSNLGVGDRLPAHATPAGFLLLGALSTDELALLYRGVQLEALTEHTPTIFDELQRQIAASALRGYVVSRGSVHEGGISIAAPVYGADGRITAVIDISGPATVFDTALLDTVYRDHVIAAAQHISHCLGYKARD